jgi:uncharacterized membrane protein YvbJ
MEENQDIASDQTNPNLFRCYQCGGWVSKEAERCPHCGGFPTKMQSEHNEVKKTSSNPNLVSDLLIYTGILIIVICSLLSSLLSLFTR